MYYICVLCCVTHVLLFSLSFSAPSFPSSVAWRAVIDCVQEARAGARLRQLSFSGMTGTHMLGLLHDTVVFLVEQLQGARRCHSHAFRFFKQISQEEDLPVNPSALEVKYRNYKGSHYFGM